MTGTIAARYSVFVVALALFSACVHLEEFPLTPVIIRTTAAEHLRAGANDFVARMVALSRAPGWVGATIDAAGQPLLSPGASSPDYTLFTLTAKGAPAGYLIVRANGDGVYVPQWSDRGGSPAPAAVANARKLNREPARLYYLGPLEIAAEDANGNLIGYDAITFPDPKARPGKPEAHLYKPGMAVPQILKTPKTPTTGLSWPAYKAALTGVVHNPGGGSGSGGHGAHPCHPPGSQKPVQTVTRFPTDWWPYYRQLPPNAAPNTDNHFTGCGPTAWVIAMAWGQHRAFHINDKWRVADNMIRRNGVVTNSPVDPTALFYNEALVIDPTIGGTTILLKDLLGTFDVPCSDQAATLPEDMGPGLQGYLTRVQASVDVYTNFDHLFMTTEGLREDAVNHLSGGPVVLGTGFMKHYPVAYQHVEDGVETCNVDGTTTYTMLDRYFVVDDGQGNGNGDPDDEHIDASTWFVGQITPEPPPPQDSCSKLSGLAHICCENPSAKQCQTNPCAGLRGQQLVCCQNPDAKGCPGAGPQ